MKRITTLLAFIVCILPGVILSVNRVIDPYFCTTLAVVETSYESGTISPATFGDLTYDPFESGHLGYPTLILLISHATGLSVLDTAFLPIGSVIVPFMAFAFARRLFKSDMTAILLAMFISFDPSLSPGQYSVFAYAWERALLFAILMSILRLYSSTNRRMNLLTILVMFVGLFMIYWTTPILIIVFIITMSLVITRRDSDRSRSDIVGNTAPYGILALVVIYLAFSKILYSEFLPAVLYETYGSYHDAIGQLLAWSPFGTSGYENVMYGSSSSGDAFLSWLLIARYAIILVPVGLYILMYLRKSLKSRWTCDGIKEAVVLPTLTTGVAQTVGYALRGHLSLRYISLLFPSLTVIAMEKLGYARLKHAPLVILIAVSLLALAYTMVEDSVGVNQDTGISDSFGFMLMHSDPEAVTLMDLNTYGIYLIHGVAENSSIPVRFYTSDAYGYLIGDYSHLSDSETPFEYIVVNINLVDSSIVAPGWTRYEPLVDHLCEIENNSLLSQTYDDGKVLVLFNV